MEQLGIIKVQHRSEERRTNLCGNSKEEHIYAPPIGEEGVTGQDDRDYQLLTARPLSEKGLTRKI